MLIETFNIVENADAKKGLHIYPIFVFFVKRKQKSVTRCIQITDMQLQLLQFQVYYCTKSDFFFTDSL